MSSLSELAITIREHIPDATVVADVRIEGFLRARLTSPEKSDYLRDEAIQILRMAQIKLGNLRMSDYGPKRLIQNGVTVEVLEKVIESLKIE